MCSYYVLKLSIPLFFKEHFPKKYDLEFIGTIEFFVIKDGETNVFLKNQVIDFHADVYILFPYVISHTTP